MTHRSAAGCFGLVADFGDVRANDLPVSTGIHQLEVWVTSEFHLLVTKVWKMLTALRVTAQSGHHFVIESAVYPFTVEVLSLIIAAQALIS